MSIIDEKIAYIQSIEAKVSTFLTKLKEIEIIAISIQEEINKGLEDIGKEMNEIENYFMNQYDSMKREIEDGNHDFPF